MCLWRKARCVDLSIGASVSFYGPSLHLLLLLLLVDLYNPSPSHLETLRCEYSHFCVNNRGLVARHGPAHASSGNLLASRLLLTPHRLLLTPHALSLPTTSSTHPKYLSMGRSKGSNKNKVRTVVYIYLISECEPLFNHRSREDAQDTLIKTKTV